MARASGQNLTADAIGDALNLATTLQECGRLRFDGQVIITGERLFWLGLGFWFGSHDGVPCTKVDQSMGKAPKLLEVIAGGCHQPAILKGVKSLTKLI